MNKAVNIVIKTSELSKLLGLPDEADITDIYIDRDTYGYINIVVNGVGYETKVGYQLRNFLYENIEYYKKRFVAEDVWGN